MACSHRDLRASQNNIYSSQLTTAGGTTWGTNKRVTDNTAAVKDFPSFGKAFLLRSLNPTECLRYALSQPGVHVAICGAGTQGQMEDNIRAVQNLRKMTSEEMADIRKRAVDGLGVHAGPTMEYWKKKA